MQLGHWMCLNRTATLERFPRLTEIILTHRCDMMVGLTVYRNVCDLCSDGLSQCNHNWRLVHQKIDLPDLLLKQQHLLASDYLLFIRKYL